MVAVDQYIPGVGPFASSVQQGLQLAIEFVRCPEVIIVEEGDPHSSCLLEASITSPALASRRLVAHQPDPGVMEVGNHLVRVVLRSIVDDHNLEVYVTLRQCRSKRQGEPPAPIMGGNHHAHEWRLYHLSDPIYAPLLQPFNLIATLPTNRSRPIGPGSHRPSR